MPGSKSFKGIFRVNLTKAKSFRDDKKEWENLSCFYVPFFTATAQMLHFLVPPLYFFYISIVPMFLYFLVSYNTS